MGIQSEFSGRSGIVKIPPLASNYQNPLIPDDFQDKFTAVVSLQPTTLNIQPGETAVIADINVGGIITKLWFDGCFNRDLILRCFWDEQSYPSVEVPVTDFFGTGWYDPENKIPMGVATINSAMLSCSPDNGMNCLFPMPFLRRALITVENHNVIPIEFRYRYSFSDYSLPDGITMEEREIRVSPSPLAPSVSIKGSILEKWEDMGGSGSALGYPLFNEQNYYDVAKWQKFQRGVMVSHPSYGTHAIIGRFYLIWADEIGINGTLKYPSRKYSATSVPTHFSFCPRWSRPASAS